MHRKWRRVGALDHCACSLYKLRAFHKVNSRTSLQQSLIQHENTLAISDIFYEPILIHDLDYLLYLLIQYVCADNIEVQLYSWQ